jgi:hypothetical protein
MKEKGFFQEAKVEPWNKKVLPKGRGLAMKYKGFPEGRVEPWNIKVFSRRRGLAMK